LGNESARFDGKAAKKAYQKALSAEKAEDWQAALDEYSEAVARAPGNPEYLVRRELARYRLVQQHMDRAEREALAGRSEQARGELRAALALDPSYSAAAERLQQLPPPTPREPHKPAQYEAGARQLKPRPGTRSIDYRGNTRGGYEEVARQFGVTATFDEDLHLR
jgi:tetratricopeptide (TPR) repeat protein